MDTKEPIADSGVEIDLTRLPLDELWSLDDTTVMGHSLRTAAEAAARQPQDIVSSFNSAI